ncbi:hypothetical protein M0802_007909 [Mischocyttarus mexicanus]|nr:hypothetical protein M0802_007909 [Mischocyttarus mexicanus]
MKTSRYKKARKNLAFYINNFKFRQPYQILIDGTFALAALKNKFNIQDQLPKYFQAETKLLTTACIIVEIEKLGSFSKEIVGAMHIIKRYIVHRCGHEKKPIPGSKCLMSMIGKDNSSRYIIATQDRGLQNELRQIPCAPLLYLHGKAPTLETPSKASQKYAENIKSNLGISTWEKENMKTLKKEAGLIDEIEPKRKKKHKKGGPNPLSCLKKKKKAETLTKVSDKPKSGKIKKKKKIKIAAHVKEALVTELSNKTQSS